LVPPVYHALADNFTVLHSMSNPGHPEGRDTVPQELEDLGVMKFPCCREFNLIHKRFFPKSSLATKPNKSMVSIKRSIYGDGLSTKSCTNIEHVGDIAFCRQTLKDAGNRCLVFAFGASTDDEVNFLKLLGSDSDFADCRVWAMDPTKSEKNWGEGGAKAFFGKNVEFYPWGLYTEDGHRQVLTDDPTHGKTRGQLFRLDEIERNYLEWEPLTISYVERDRLQKKVFLQSPGTEVTLMRVSCFDGQACLANLAEMMDESRRQRYKQVI